MSRIVVAGGANLDRIVRLDAPLRHGGRTHYREIVTRWGGGGVNSAAALAALGHQVSLVARIAKGDSGDAFLAALAERGIDTRHVLRIDGPLRTAEILLEPSGERTILLPGPSAPLRLPDLSAESPNLLYIAARQLEGPIPPDVPTVAQLPSDPAAPCPAETLIASRSDFPNLPLDVLHDRARAAAGSAFRRFVVTNGRDGVVLFQNDRRVIPIEAGDVPSDTTGAGDFFAAGLIHAVLAGAEADLCVKEAAATAQFFLRTRPI